MTQGMASGTNRRFAHTATTTGSRADVWQLWTDVETWKRWDHGLVDAVIDGPFDDGVTGTIVPKRGRDAAFTVIDVEPDQGYVFATSLPGARLVVRRDFVHGPVTTFRHAVHFEGPLALLWASLLGRGFRRALPPTMQALADLAGGGS